MAKRTKAELEAELAELKAQQMVTVEAPRAEPVGRQDNRVTLGITVALGCGIPLLSIALSKIGGTLLTTHVPLALFAFSLMVAVLVVSLPHLRWSIGDITKSGDRASWSLAVALDLSLVLCELVHVYATDSGLDALVVAVMTSVCIASMVLNCWAFLKSPQH